VVEVQVRAQELEVPVRDRGLVQAQAGPEQGLELLQEHLATVI